VFIVFIVSSIIMFGRAVACCQLNVRAVRIQAAECLHQRRTAPKSRQIQHRDEDSPRRREELDREPEHDQNNTATTQQDEVKMHNNGATKNERKHENARAMAIIK
jgi:hypothetical protein